VKPYYQDSLVTLYHGDCRGILPHVGRFDLLLTDPPYGIGRDGQDMSTGKHGGRKAYKHKGWDADRPAKETFDAMLSVADQHIIWGGNYFADLLPPTMRWLVWDKGQRINQSDGELAWTSLRGALRIYTLNRVALMTDVAVHPTQKPLELMSWCLGFAPDAKSVLDPFCGSGTTLRAAKDSGLKAVGIEVDEEYCALAAERLRQEVLDLGGAA
jgi:site-specific DNA-methyltransferase (adenine-specific)